MPLTTPHFLVQLLVTNWVPSPFADHFRHWLVGPAPNFWVGGNIKLLVPSQTFGSCELQTNGVL